MDIKLIMPTTQDNSMSGINDGNIETFRNKMMLSLTKEELQNSTDNAVSVDGVPQRVTVEFHDFYIPTGKLPQVEELISVFEDEKAFWDAYMTTDKKAVKVLDKAISLLRKDSIRCLRISDFNTTGLTGIMSEHASPWLNLVCNRGVSDKPSSATGSFGIGKDAAFACSELRTVFYNTLNVDAADNAAFQGTVKLPTYKKDGINYTGFGSFARDVNGTVMPILENVSIDPGYARTTSGMDKYIIGFFADLDGEELKREIIVSSINNFLCAFWEDKLVLKCGDVVVDKDHLEEVIETYKDSLDSLTLDYYATLKAPDKTFTVSVLEENDVAIYVRLLENSGRRAAIVRKSGMKVFDKGYISKRIEFSAVVILTGDKANQFFKELENPEHTAWSLDRTDNKALAQQKQAVIFNALRDAVSELQQANATDAIDADGLNEYLPFAYVTGHRKRIEGLSNEVANKTKAPKKKHKKKPAAAKPEPLVTYEYDENGEEIVDVYVDTNGGSGNNGGGGGGGTGHGGSEIIPGKPDSGNSNVIPGNADASGKFISKRALPNSSVKYILNRDGDTYHLKVIPNTNVKKGFAEIKVSSEQSAIVMPLANASVNAAAAEISVNKIAFDKLDANAKYDFAFKFKQSGEWACEVDIHEN